MLEGSQMTGYVAAPPTERVYRVVTVGGNALELTRAEENEHSEYLLKHPAYQNYLATIRRGQIAELLIKSGTREYRDAAGCAIDNVRILQNELFEFDRLTADLFRVTAEWDAARLKRLDGGRETRRRELLRIMEAGVLQTPILSPEAGVLSGSPKLAEARAQVIRDVQSITGKIADNPPPGKTPD